MTNLQKRQLRHELRKLSQGAIKLLQQVIFLLVSGYLIGVVIYALYRAGLELII